jgi:DNA-binding XRE family transcriptional regulator
MLIAKLAYKQIYLLITIYNGILSKFIIIIQGGEVMELSNVDKASQEDLVKVGIKIKGQRNLKKMTQDKLAELSGVDKYTISKIESPNQFHNCELLTILRLAAALDIRPIKFFDFADLE